MDAQDRLTDWLVRWEDAPAADRPGLLAALGRDDPELVTEFLKLVHGLKPVNAFLCGRASGAPSPEEVAGIEAGRYRPVKFHARGGLGVVFTATDAELNRTVALKRMQELAAHDADARRRFLLEAEITGHLEHPGVVPVYGLGRDADGRPYYAMRFVRGDTLSEAIDQFHTPAAPPAAAERNVEFRRLLRGFVTVCETIAYAHSQGVIHRDIKPGNIMLGPYGESLVLDWGLAKVLSAERGPRCEAPQNGQAPVLSSLEETVDQGIERFRLDTEDGVHRTAYGQAKGTWVYMSPEQARGEWDRVGPASDVYSLGSTLYTLLTGRRAYDGSTTAEVSAKVQQGLFAPPRQANPAVPRPLDAVCCKAMAFDPAARYPDARELARDLDRWLADEPVTAWREPFSIRARRWLKRHRTKVMAAAAALVVGVAALVAGLVLVSAKNQQLESAYGSLSVSNAKLETANTNLQATNDELRASKGRVERLAQNTLESDREIVEGVIGNPLLRKPGMAAVRQTLLKSVVRHCKGVIANYRADAPGVRGQLAYAHYAVGVLADETGQADEARAEYRQALDLFRTLRKEDADDRRLIVLTAATTQRLGLLELNAGATLRGLTLLEDTIRVLDHRPATGADDAEVRTLRFAARLVAWEAFARVGRMKRAAELRAAAAAHLDQLGDPVKANLPDELRTMLAIGYGDFGAAALRAGRLDEADRRLATAARLCDRPDAASEPEPLRQALRARVTLHQAEVLAARGHAAKALDLCKPAREALTRLGAVAAELPAQRLWAAEAALTEGRIAYRAGQYDRALAPLQDADDQFDALARESRPQPEALTGLVQTCQMLAEVYRGRGDFARAERTNAEARRQLERLESMGGRSPQHRAADAAVLNTAGLLYLRSLKPGDKPRAGEDRFVRAIRVLERLAEDDPEDPRHRLELGVAWMNLARARIVSKEPAREVLAAVDRGDEILRAVAREYPDVAEFAAVRDRELANLRPYLPKRK